jgi:predicted O-methyltransferase YrrM
MDRVAHDPSFHALSAAALAARIIAENDLRAEAAEVVQHALGHIEKFYATRKALNFRGEIIDVTKSPVPQASGRALLRAAIARKVERTLEVGFSFGMSTCHLLTAHEVTGGVEHVAIDPFQMSKYYQGTGLINVTHCGLLSRLNWVKELSNIALPRMYANGDKFDLCFVDGSHIFTDIIVDAYFCMSMLPEGGTLVLDDCWLPAVRTVRNILVSNCGFTEEPDPSAQNLAILRKSGPGRLDWTDFERQWTPFQVG